jgi:hypothetical protein
MTETRAQREARARHPWTVAALRPALLLAMLVLAAAGLAAAGLAAAELVAAEFTYPQARITAGGHGFTVDVAQTAETQTLGLGGRRFLGPSDGMLFVYAEKSRYTFWMKGMLIPIDMIWLDNRRIVHIERRVPPPQPNAAEFSLPTYAPEQPANFVLEIAAGRSDELHLKEGDLVTYDFSAPRR